MSLLFWGNVISIVLSKYLATSAAFPDLIALITSVIEMNLKEDIAKIIKRKKVKVFSFEYNLAQIS